MPIIYLSPSTQENNLYVTGGSEEEWMNRLADAMVPYLDSSGIQYVRNTPDMTAASSIRASNAGNYDLHLALHSNAAPEHLTGVLYGPDGLPMEEKAAGWQTWAIVGGCVLAGIIALVVVRKKRKAARLLAELEEDNNEDI